MADLNTLALSIPSELLDALKALPAQREVRHCDSVFFVNPFDIYGQAQTIHEALTMSAEERRRRALAIRSHVREHNVYRWAALLLAELGRMPQSASAIRD